MMPFKLTVVMYHFVGDPIFPGLKTLPLADFRRQLSHLQKNYHLIAWPDLADFILHKRPLPPNACLITFDDGTKDHLNVVLPELIFKKVPAIFFILGREPKDGVAFVHKVQMLTAKLGEAKFRKDFLKLLDKDTKDLFNKCEVKCLKDYPESKYDDLTFRTFKRVIGKYMFNEAEPFIDKLFDEFIGDEKDWAKKLYLSDSDIMKMTKVGMHFGGHGSDHRWMSTLNQPEKEKEIKNMAEKLKKIELSPWAFSYPYGDYDETIFPILKTNGFVAGFTTKESISHSNEYELYRLDANSLPK